MTTRNYSNSKSSSAGYDDILIAVMGSTGTGKSSFIRLLSGDNSVRIGDDVESETSDIQVVRFYDAKIGRNVIIVDTPGFDDSRAGITDTAVLKKITNFLLKTYDDKRKLNGLVYLQRVSDPRFGGQSVRNLRMFRDLCGTKAYENVMVLTTFWDQAGTQGEKREESLKAKFFNDLLDGGACFMRHNRTIESARDVLRHISTLVSTNVQIQEEIRLQGKALEDTAAGSVHREEVEEIIAKHKKEMLELKDELETMKKGNIALRQELQEERATVQRQLARWEDERAELKKGLDMAHKVQRQMEADRLRERADNEKWRQGQERKWTSQFDDQKHSYDEAAQRLRSQLNKKDRQLQEEAKREAGRREEERKRNEEWHREQERKWELRFSDLKQKHDKATPLSRLDRKAGRMVRKLQRKHGQPAVKEAVERVLE